MVDIETLEDEARRGCVVRRNRDGAVGVVFTYDPVGVGRGSRFLVLTNMGQRTWWKEADVTVVEGAREGVPVFKGQKRREGVALVARTPRKTFYEKLLDKKW